jgi:hypothetical protein
VKLANNGKRWTEWTDIQRSRNPAYGASLVAFSVFFSRGL